MVDENLGSLRDGEKKKKKTALDASVKSDRSMETVLENEGKKVKENKLLKEYVQNTLNESEDCEDSKTSNTRDVHKLKRGYMKIAEQGNIT